MPRAARQYVPVGPEQGATRRITLPEYRQALPEALNDNRYQRGSKVPQVVKTAEKVWRVTRFLRRGNALGKAVDVGWTLGEAYYDYLHREQEEYDAWMNEEVEDILEAEDEQIQQEWDFGVVTSTRRPTWDEMNFAGHGWTTILGYADINGWGDWGWTSVSDASSFTTHAYGDDAFMAFLTPDDWNEAFYGTGHTDVVVMSNSRGSPGLETTVQASFKRNAGTDPGPSDPITVETPVTLPRTHRDPNRERFIRTLFGEDDWSVREEWQEQDEIRARKERFGPDGKQRLRPHDREPPRKREREPAKTISKSVTVMIAIFHALDAISEYAELVDAFYDALPEDVRARWGKGRKSRGLIDQAGQYGIDGADWKLQALWYNYDKIDGPKAFKNIVANEYQDKILGLIHKNVPRNSGHALDSGLNATNDEIAEFLGLIGVQ